MATVQDSKEMKCAKIFWECVQKLPNKPNSQTKPHKLDIFVFIAKKEETILDFIQTKNLESIPLII